MPMKSHLGLFLLVPFLCTQISARQNHSAAHPGDRVYLDVVVSPKSGPPMKGLQQSDFTILDNDVPHTITSFEAVAGGQARIEVTVILGAVNIGSRGAAITFEEINKFLKSDGGRLAHPTALAILTEKGLQSPLDFSQDGERHQRRTQSHLGRHRSFLGFRLKPLGRFWPPNVRSLDARLSFGCLRGGHHWPAWRTSKARSFDSCRKKCSEMSLRSRRSSGRAGLRSTVWTLPLWATLIWALQTRRPFT